MPFHRIQPGQSCPLRNLRTQLHLGSSCSRLVTAVAAGVVPFAVAHGESGVAPHHPPETAWPSAEVLFLQDHAGPVSYVKK